MSVRIRFAVVVAYRLVVPLMAAGTIVRSDWIERLLHFELDGGNGSVEWIAVTALVAVITYVLQRNRELRRVVCRSPNGVLAS